MTLPRYRYAPGPPPPRGKTHPHDAGRPERAEAAAPRSEEVLLLRVRTDGPVIGRETLGRDRPAPRREPGGDPRAALEGRQADEGPPRHGPRGGREAGARVAGERIRRLIRRSEPRIGSGRP